MSVFRGPTPNVGTVAKPLTPNVGSVTKTVRASAEVPLRRDPTTYRILVMPIDDIGPEFLDFYDAGTATVKAKTPNLSALANAGLIFDNGYAAPVCTPTRAMINTGLYAHKTGMGTTNTGVESPTTRLSDSLQWMPEAMRDGRGQGVFLRSAWGKWHMCTPVPGVLPTGNDGHPKDNGYTRYSGQMINAGGNSANGDWDHYIWRKVANSGNTVTSTQVGNPADYLANGVTVPGSNVTYATDDNWDGGVNAREFVAWANIQPRSWIAYLAFNAPHAPYQVPPYAYLSAGTVADLVSAGMAQGYKADTSIDLAKARLAFRASMEAIDYWIGWIRANLSAGQTDNLMTICPGDNGTEGVLIDETEDSPLTQAHGKRTVYEQGVRVPFFVHGPLVASPGRRSDHLVHVVDILRTVLDIGTVQFGFSKLAAGSIQPESDSKSFFGIIRDPAAPPHRDRIWTHTFTPNLDLRDYVQQPTSVVNRDTYAIRDARWKYLYLFASGTTIEQFYDLSVDPNESNNLFIRGFSVMSLEQQAAFTRLKAEAQAILAT